MLTERLYKKITSIDDRRNIAIPGNAEDTLTYCAEHFIEIAKVAIDSKGTFYVALSGGSTPRALYQLLASPSYNKQINWNKVQIFWSDERSVPPGNTESNYHMAMEAGLKSLPIPKENIHRMNAESQNIEAAALEYEKLIEKIVPKSQFDFVMLGMGEDGHTASLFPRTHGLHVQNRLIIANFIPEKNTWRMSFTYKLINDASHITIYVIGKSKASMLKQVLNGHYIPDDLPIQRVGTSAHKALWIVDSDAASDLIINNTNNIRDIPTSS